MFVSIGSRHGPSTMPNKISGNHLDAVSVIAMLSRQPVEVLTGQRPQDLFFFKKQANFIKPIQPAFISILGKAVGVAQWYITGLPNDDGRFLFSLTQTNCFKSYANLLFLSTVCW